MATTDNNHPNETLIPINIEDEMKDSYLSYAMSVIIGRAIPDIRDGLKPVHRRVLYAMHEMDNVHNKPYKKSARVVGDVIGKYHPHGDMAVYDTIVRMAQDFSLRYPLVDGQGNFGSVDGDSPAAMRYTEIRMDKLTQEVLKDIEKETVSFEPNYDESTVEPTILPAKIPNLLINGSTGIAVGMATNIPPHNLSEVLSATFLLLDNPDTTIAEIMKVLPGPDFPTGAYINGTAGIHKAYTEGKGIIQLRAKHAIETDKKDRESIIVTELPYMVNKANLIEKIAYLVRDKKVTGISDLRDESDRQGMRIVIDLKKDAIAQVVVNQLYKYTQLQTSFGIIFLAIANRRPKIFTIKEALSYFIDHRKDIVRKRTQFDLKKTEHRLHLLEGFLVAIKNIDEVVKIIRASKDTSAAKQSLMDRFEFSPIQAQAILDMRLGRLTALEHDKIQDEHKACIALIKELKKILSDAHRLVEVIKEELEEIKKKYDDKRRSQIIQRIDDLNIEDLIEDNEMVVTISHRGYIKRVLPESYRVQHRGGHGVTGMNTKQEDFVRDIFVASMHSYILFFTTQGRLHWLKVHGIPEGSRTSKGKAIVNLIQLREDEKVSAILPIKEFNDDQFVVLATASGTIKKVSLTEFSNPRAGGIIAVSLKDDDQLIGAELTNGSQDIFLATANGQSIRFSERDLRPMGRQARGVRGITLAKKSQVGPDHVVGMEIIDEGFNILTVNEMGLGKRTKASDYRVQSRGGKGILTVKVTPKNGKVVSVKQVADEQEVMLITNYGKLIRMKVSQISLIGRNTQGVRLIQVNDQERVVGTEILAPEATTTDESNES